MTNLKNEILIRARGVEVLDTVLTGQEHRDLGALRIGLRKSLIDSSILGVILSHLNLRGDTSAHQTNTTSRRGRREDTRKERWTARIGKRSR